MIRNAGKFGFEFVERTEALRHFFKMIYVAMADKSSIARAFDFFLLFNVFFS